MIGTADALSLGRSADRDGNADLRSTGAGIVDASTSRRYACARQARRTSGYSGRSFRGWLCDLLQSGQLQAGAHPFGCLHLAGLGLESDSFNAGWIQSRRPLLCDLVVSVVLPQCALPQPSAPMFDFEGFLAMTCSRTGT